MFKRLFSAAVILSQTFALPKDKLSNDLFTLSELKEPYAEKLTVHMIHHTHDDVGWLKTVDEYYTGANDVNAHASVENIITTVV